MYEIKFGNGVVGSRLSKGDRIYVMYLQTNGNQGQLTLEEYGQPKLLIHNAASFGMTQEMYETIFTVHEYAVPSSEILMYMHNLTTQAISEENPDDIRKSAPEWFKLGQRLVTLDDYTYYIKNMHKGEVCDVCVMNNFQYAAKFYKWLYSLGKMLHGNGAYYIN